MDNIEYIKKTGFFKLVLHCKCWQLKIMTIRTKYRSLMLPSLSYSNVYGTVEAGWPGSTEHQSHDEHILEHSLCFVFRCKICDVPSNMTRAHSIKIHLWIRPIKMSNPIHYQSSIWGQYQPQYWLSIFSVSQLNNQLAFTYRHQCQCNVCHVAFVFLEQLSQIENRKEQL